MNEGRSASAWMNNKQGLVTQVKPACRDFRRICGRLGYNDIGGRCCWWMGQQRGDSDILYVPTCTDNGAMVPITISKPFFAGLVLRAEPR